MAYLITPTNKEFPNINYYDIAMAARQIVDMYIEKDEKNKKEFENFKKDYSIFEPYIDFLITHLNYKIRKPFITDNGLLFGKDGKLFYYSDYNVIEQKPSSYPLANDKELKRHVFDVDNMVDCIVDSNGYAYDIEDRNKGEFHGRTWSIILMHYATNNRKVFDDFSTYMIENPNEPDRGINKYFRTMYGNLQIVKYPDNTGHIIYNPDMVNEKTLEIINEINNKYPKIRLEKEILDEDEIDVFKNRINNINNISSRTI